MPLVILLLFTQSLFAHFDLTLKKVCIKDSQIFDIIATVDDVAPQDTSYYNYYGLDFYTLTIVDDTLCSAYKGCLQDVCFHDDTSYVGYCVINNQILLVEGKEALPFFSGVEDSETKTFASNPFPSFTEYVKPFPQFRIRNDSVFQIIPRQTTYNLYDYAIKVVACDNHLDKDRIAINKICETSVEEDILSVLISSYGSKPIISFLDAYSLKEEMRSDYFDFEIKVDIPYPSAEIQYSKMKHGYFYLNYIMGEKCKRYYFEINRDLSCHLLYQESIVLP